MSFPAESVPDGAIFAPHHFLYPLYAVLVLYFLKLNDDPERKPALVLVGPVVALVGWFHFWPYYPGTGAIIAAVGVILCIIGGIAHRNVETHWRISIVALCLLSLEDWVDHAFDVDTPASLAFHEYIQPVLF